MLIQKLTARGGQVALILNLSILFSVPLAAGESTAGEEGLVGALLSPQNARVVVRRERCRCQPLAEGGTDALLLTLGTESEPDGTRFHPLATLAFDQTLSENGTGQWMALWIYGPSAAGWRRTVRAFLPLPVGGPKASARTLAKLDQRLEEVRQNPDRAKLMVPDPVVHLANLGKYPRSQGIWGSLRRGLAWANLFNPAQIIYRSYLLRRKDRKERDFQRAYLSLQWLLDQEYDGEQELAWLDTLNDLRFHLLRNRSFFGSWLEHADGVELVYNYESASRVKLGKSSSWLQSAANEHHLRYQPIYHYTTNGAAYPMGGVLYYDRSLGAQPDPGWWDIANPFDLRYNPHTHPGVQRLAAEHPDQLIPLSVYIFQTNLALRPIIAIDFFDPGNPRTRENTQQMMVMSKQWLAITTGTLALERLSYQFTAWAANKKGFTLLVDKSARQGIEELRLSLEADLYFDPTLRPLLLKRADKRVLNPLIKAGSVEERLAQIQYLSLRARDYQALCKTLKKVRKKMLHRLHVPDGLAPEAQRAELARRLLSWRQQVRLSDLLSQPVGDFGSLASLEKPLTYFLTHEPLDPSEFQQIIARLYAKLYRQQISLPPGHTVPELEATLALSEKVWKQVGADPEDYERRRAQVEQKARARYQRQLAKREAKRLERLRTFLSASQLELKRAQAAGCERPGATPGSLEAHLAVLRDVLGVAFQDEKLRPEMERQAVKLRAQLEELEAVLSQCSAESLEPQLAESHQFSRELAQALSQGLAQEIQLSATRGD